MTCDYKNSLTYPRTDLFGGNVNSNFVDRFESQVNTVQKTKKPSFFGNDITNTSAKNNKVNNSLFKSRLNQSEKSGGKLFSDSSEESDSVEDSWNMDSDEENFSLSKSKLNRMPLGFQSRSGYTSSGSDSPTRSDENEIYSNRSLSRGVRELTLEQNSSSEEYSGSSMDCVSNSGSVSSSAASSSVKTNRLVESKSYLGSPTKYASSHYESPVSNASKKRTLDEFNGNPFDNGTISTPVKEYASTDFFDSKTPSVMPEAPSKKRSTALNPFVTKPKNPFVAKLERVLASREFTFCGNDRLVKFSIGKWVGRGDFSEVYKVASAQTIVPKYTNDQLLLKRYHQASIERDEAALEKCIGRSLEQYNYLEENDPDFSVAKIFNAASAPSDLYFLVEMVPDEFLINWTKDTKYKDLAEEDKNRLTQVKKMYQFSFDHGICLDVKRDNIRIHKNGEPVLCDFLEIKRKLKYVIENNIDSFACGNEEIREYLRPVGYVKLG